MYTPLFVKTDYSLLSSLIKVDKLIAFLKSNNFTSCAICDNNLFGTMEIINKFNKNNLKPIIGLDINYNSNRLLLLAKNEIGYHNLIKIETIKNEKELSLDILSDYSKELVVITFLENKDFEILKKIYNDLYIAVTDNKEVEFAKEITNNYVYAKETLYLEKYEYKYLPYLSMIKNGKTISDGINFLYQDNYLYKSNELNGTIDISAINNTLKITDMIDLKFTKALYMPKYDTLDSKQFLISLSKKGLDKRLKGNVSDIYLKRLNYELDIITKMHFEDYFLVVFDYIKYAKKHDILVGPGRGSAAGSLVSYSLGITEVDPIKYNLLFERFLNPERVTMPDIDTDFPDIDRDKVIEYVKTKYGFENVAGIITFGTLGAKQAVRDVGRVLNIPIKDVDLICKKLGPKDSLKDLIKKDQDVRDILSSNDKYKLFYNIESEIEGNKRHTSIHAAGVVISAKKLIDVCPTIKSDSYDMYLTEYTMEYLEQIGLIKMDFLGIKNLSIIKNILDDIKINTNISINFNDIPLDDSKTIELFNTADTTGIFQFESAGMKQFLKELKVRSFNDICSAIALFRPGPAINIPSFIKRREKKEQIDYIIPNFEPILKETFGIIVYQEQIMQIASTMSSYTLGEADILRRAMSKKKYDVLKSEEPKFISNAIKNGYSNEIAKKVYDLILNFANYGFNKSHSVSYSIVAFKMAYLKCHYSKYFYANLLNGVIGSETKTLEYINELKKIGLKVLPPDINISKANKYLVTEKGIIMPLSAIRNIGSTVSQFIESERVNGKYEDIFDFLKRTYEKTNNRKIIESLIYSHSLTSLGYNINTLMSNFDSISNYISLINDIDINTIPKPEINEKNELSIDDILDKEHNIFGFYLTSHQTEKYKLNDNTIIDIDSFKNNLNRNANIIFYVDKKKELITKNGKTMAFVTGSDNTSTTTIVFFPQIYENQTINKGNVIKGTGKIEKRFNEYQFIINKVEVLK